MSATKTDGGLTVGAAVTYADINLRDYRGKIESIGKTRRGGDCVVAWITPSIYKSEECLFNLKKAN